MEVLGIVGVLIVAVLVYFFCKITWFIIKIVVGVLFTFVIFALAYSVVMNPEAAERLKEKAWAELNVNGNYDHYSKSESKAKSVKVTAKKSETFDEFVGDYDGNLPFSVLKRFANEDGVLKISAELYNEFNPEGLTRIGINFFGNRGYVNGAGEIYIKDKNSLDNIMVIPY